MMKLARTILVLFMTISTTLTYGQETQPFALIELYTSQGCSSCPRADAYLSDIIDEAESRGQKIIALSFHVDYWNRLGWADPYSSRENTQRQYSYAQSMRSSNVYTPQMVINGKVEFVGSNRQKGQEAIRQALYKAPLKTIELQNLRQQEDKVWVDYQVKGHQLSERSTFNLAIVEEGISTSVGRGENRGRTLTHDNVVRVFQSFPISDLKGSASLELPADLIRKHASVVAFVQKSGLKEIEAAEMIPLKD